jgi:hypothetical protein
VSTKKFYTLKSIHKTSVEHLELNTHPIPLKNSQFCFKLPGRCSCALSFNDTSSENSYHTTQKTVCPVLSEESKTAVEPAFGTYFPSTWMFHVKFCAKFTLHTCYRLLLSSCTKQQLLCCGSSFSRLVAYGGGAQQQSLGLF